MMFYYGRMCLAFGNLSVSLGLKMQLYSLYRTRCYDNQRYVYGRGCLAFGNLSVSRVLKMQLHSLFHTRFDNQHYCQPSVPASFCSVMDQGISSLLMFDGWGMELQLSSNCCLYPICYLSYSFIKVQYMYVLFDAHTVCVLNYCVPPPPPLIETCQEENTMHVWAVACQSYSSCA